MTSEQILARAIEIERQLAEFTSPEQRHDYQISTNFMWYECFSGAIVNGVRKEKYVEPPRELWLNAVRHFLNIQLVADYLTAINKKYVAINYNSFYRTQFWNSYGDNGGSPNSKHLYAMAGDTKPLHIILAMHKYAMIIVKLCPDINGIKVYGTFVHADMQPNFIIYN